MKAKKNKTLAENLRMIISNKYLPLISENSKTYSILTGGRGSGKSVVLSLLAVLLTYQRTEAGAAKILFTRYTASSKDFSIVAQVKAVLEALNLSSQFYIKTSEIVNKKSGGQIIFTGIKTSSNELTAKLKSVTDCSTWILEEADELTSLEEFYKIRNSIRKKGIKNRVILAFNPPKKSHWLYKTFFKRALTVELDGAKIEKSTHELVTHVHTSYFDNLKNLDSDFLNEIKLARREDKERYQREFLGAWGNSKAGLIFPNFKVQARENWELTNLPNIYGLDVGSASPTAFIQVRPDYKNKKVYLHELFYEKNLSFENRASKIHFNYNLSGPGFLYTDHNRDVFKGLKSRGLNPVFARKEVFEGLDFMKSFEIIISPESENLKNELENYSFALDASGQEQVVKSNDHAIDAARYGLYTYAAQYRKIASRFEKGRIYKINSPLWKTY